MSIRESKANFQLQIYIAEYNTLTNRATYFLNIQNFLLTGLVAWVGVMLNVLISVRDNHFTPVVIWGTVLGGLMIGISSAWLFYEEHNIVYYIESCVRPKVTQLVTGNFWEYELFILKQRTKRYLLYEYIPILLPILGFICATSYSFQLRELFHTHSPSIFEAKVLRNHFSKIYLDHYIGFAIDILPLSLLYNRTIAAVKMQKTAWKSVRKNETKVKTNS